jgi:hypothetical protein
MLRKNAGIPHPWEAEYVKPDAIQSIKTAMVSLGRRLQIRRVLQDTPTDPPAEGGETPTTPPAVGVNGTETLNLTTGNSTNSTSNGTGFEDLVGPK